MSPEAYMRYPRMSPFPQPTMKPGPEDEVQSLSARVKEPNERWGGVGKTPPQTHCQLQTEGVVLVVYFPGAQESAQVRASGIPGGDADVDDFLTTVIVFDVPNGAPFTPY